MNNDNKTLNYNVFTILRVLGYILMLVASIMLIKDSIIVTAAPLGVFGLGLVSYLIGKEKQ